MRKRRADAGDAVVGHNIRAHRLVRQMSQSDLARAIGVTFQQVQKYEKGANRVGAARLVQVASALGIPATALLQGVPGTGRKRVDRSQRSYLCPLPLRERATHRVNEEEWVRGTPHPTEIADVAALPSPSRGEGATTRTVLAALLANGRRLRLVQAFAQIEDASVQQALLALTELLARLGAGQGRLGMPGTPQER